MIELNVTLWIQLANFIITLVVLNVLLIRPVRDMIRQRKETFDGMEREIADFTDRAGTELAAYEETLRKAREDAAEVRKAARAEADAQGRTLLAEADLDARESLRRSQADVRADAEQAAQSLRERVGDFAQAAVDRLLK